MQFKVKTISSLHKVFPDVTPVAEEYRSGSVISGGRFSFQLAMYYNHRIRKMEISIDSPLKEHIRLRQVALAPANYTGYYFDDKVERTSAGLYPDYLEEGRNTFSILPQQWRSVWVSVDVPENWPAGEYEIKIRFYFRGSVDGNDDLTIDCEKKLSLKVVNARLPEQALIHTEWFHGDCISTWYNCEVWSERFWRLLDNYIENYASHGANMILTPLWTLPLDTEVGHERPTLQLLDIEYKDPEFKFDFRRLKKWINLCKSKGIKYFEFVHLFTQWGATKCPKIIVKVNGKDEKMFGWHTDADGLEYQNFLNSLLPQLIEFIKQEKLEKNVFFHVSDEPEEKHFDSYSKAMNSVRELLKDFPVIDALSNLDFYRKDIVKTPIPCVANLDEFIEAGLKNPWTYYFCGSWEDFPNRFFTMPLSRVRIIGIIAYVYNMEGFLHWGYNFWNSDFSRFPINPFITTDADHAFPAGDAFLVYPGTDGPLDSIRHEALADGIQDYRLLQLTEELCGREEVLRMLHEGLDYKIDIRNYPLKAEWFDNLHSRLFETINT
jgi:hypothetical protein